jgi:hypothetical protein
MNVRFLRAGLNNHQFRRKKGKGAYSKCAGKTKESNVAIRSCLLSVGAWRETECNDNEERMNGMREPPRAERR